MLKWEKVPIKEQYQPTFTERCKIRGGWLIRIVSASSGIVRGLTFVPDPGQEWELEKTSE